MGSGTVRGGGGVDLHVDDTGTANGAPILFVHGYSQSRLSWRNQVESDLAEVFRLVSVDNRGHGLSDKPENAYGDSRLWADDIQSVIETLGLDKPVLVGWSMGGIVVLDYIDRYGDDGIAGVNLVGTVSRLGGAAATEMLGRDFLELVSGLESSDAETSVRALETFVRRCFHEGPSPEDLRFILGYNVVVPPYVRVALNARSVDHSDLLPRLEVPVLLTHGEEDAIVSPVAVEEHRESIAQVETSLYSATGHSPFWESPERFNAELKAFVNRVR